MQTILLLGGYGFLGTNLMKYIDEHLLEKYQVIVFDKFDHHLHDVRFQCVTKIYAGDFADNILLNKIFDENHIDLVIHSLSTTVPVSSFNARYDVESNLIPTLDVLGLMVKHGIRDIVYLSSGGAIYGLNNHHSPITNHQSLGFRESDDVFPVSSYGVVKLAIEKYLMQYAQLYDLRPLILRLSNPYGPYHYSMKQGVINVAMTNALRNEALEVWGDGNGKKDYFYVEDYAEILFAMLEKGVHNQIINIASGQAMSVNDIIDAIRLFVPNFRANYTQAQQLDASHFELDTTKLKSLLPDFQFTSLEEGMRKTYNWTKTIVL